MKTPEEILEAHAYFLKKAIEQAQTEAYNQAIHDSCNLISENNYPFAVSFNHKLLNLIKK